MNINKLISLSIIVCSAFFAVPPALAETSDNLSSVNASQTITRNRLYGTTKFETAKAIAENYADGQVKNVVLATGNHFADALSASVLAHEKKAPILLADIDVKGSEDAFQYILQHLASDGTIYIVGGTGIISSEFENELNKLGFRNIVRVAGYDRYDTSYRVAKELTEANSSTVVISSGEQYADALSISGFAANEGWPILLTQYDQLSHNIKEFLVEQMPSKIYVTGGNGVISDAVTSEIAALLPQASIQRLMGQTQFDTNIVIAETFGGNPSTVYLATGYNFADALAGSVVAAKNREPIILIDPYKQTLPKSTAKYFEKFYAKVLNPQLVSFGGNGVVSDEIMKNTKDLIVGSARGDSFYHVDNINVTITTKEAYSLPETVPVSLYNSDVIKLPVKWNTTVVNTYSPGVYAYYGRVEGYPDVITLNLNVKEPEPILLSQYTTYFDPSQVNRTENLRLATMAINDKLLAPGALFSFNAVVGERTAEAGYKEALVIEGDAFTPGLGGGVCQVSSTLYNAVMAADLKVVERHTHSLPVSYVPEGKDATVAWPVLDFKFRNNTKDYLSIRGTIKDNTLNFWLYKKL